ncbi:unnamed protein product, partial [Prorocentrum cordatum]
GLQSDASNMGDRLRELFRVRSVAASAAADIRPPLVTLVRQVLQPPRVCGDGAATSVEGMAMREASEAVVIRVESMHHQMTCDMFAVDARADWRATVFPVSVMGGDAVPYEVAAFVQGRAARMRSGHVACVNKAGRWFELDDAVVTELPEPPEAYPYLVFLARARPRRSIPMGGKRRGLGEPDDALEAAAELPRLDHAASRGSAAGSASGSGSGGRGLPCAASSAARLGQRGKDRKGRNQTGRDQSGHDHAGRDQTGRDRAGQQAGIAGVHPAARAVWNASAAADNRNHTRADAENSVDDPVQRCVGTWDLRRSSADVKRRSWSPKGREFAFREDWKKHVDDEHGGVQRYPNALFSTLSLKPYVVKGEAWREIVANYADFYARSATDWEKPTQRMRELAQSPEGLPAAERWAPRTRCAYVFCARLHWSEDLSWELLAGEDCFVKNPEAVAKLLFGEVYHKHWPDIPEAELRASALRLRIGDADTFQLVLMFL